MKEKRFILPRLEQDTRQTSGHLLIFVGRDRLHDFVTIEPGWQDNARNVSCIPAGRYWMTVEDSPKFGRPVLLLHGVPDRDAVEIHGGCFRRNTRGCQLPGTHFLNLDKDDLIDVADSWNTVDRIIGQVPEGGAWLEILPGPLELAEE